MNEDVLQELPEGWVWTTIGDIFEIPYGKGLIEAKRNQKVSPPKRVMLPIANKCISTNLPIFYYILHVLETMNNPFSKHYLYNQMSKTFLPQSVPQVMAS
jgi:hypothetical protein